MAIRKNYRVGRRYGTFEGHGVYEYPCTFAGFGWCCHFCCRMAALRKARHADTAEQLERNSKAQDWLRHWGKLLYDPAEHGRDPKRRSAAAAIVREMRRGRADFADAVRAGAWTGVALS